MTVYFCSGAFDVFETASTESDRLRIVDDTQYLAVGFGSSSLEVAIQYDGDPPDLVGLFMLLPGETENRLFQVIETEVDYIAKTIRAYGEDRLLCLYCEGIVTGSSGLGIGYTIEDYISDLLNIKNNRHPWFHIGHDETMYHHENGDVLPAYLRGMPGSAKNIAEAFTQLQTSHNIELSFRWEWNGSKAADFFVDIKKAGGTDTGEILTVGKEITQMRETADASQIATAIIVNGEWEAGTSSVWDVGNVWNDADGNPAYEVTRAGYIQNGTVKYQPVNETRMIVNYKARARYCLGDYKYMCDAYNNIAVANSDEYITWNDVAKAELDAVSEPLYNYECECVRDCEVGYIYTIDFGHKTKNARCLAIEKSETQKTYAPTFGDYLIKQNAFETMARNVGG